MVLFKALTNVGIIAEPIRFILRTSLIQVLQRSEGVGASYVDLYRTSTILSIRILLPCCSSCFCRQHTVVAGNFGPYHCLWCGDAPSKCIGITPTLGEMISALGLGVVMPQPKMWVTYLQHVFVVSFCMHTSTHFTVNISYMKCINTTKLPPPHPPISPHHPPLGWTQQSIVKVGSFEGDTMEDMLWKQQMDLARQMKLHSKLSDSRADAFDNRSSQVVPLSMVGMTTSL